MLNLYTPRTCQSLKTSTVPGAPCALRQTNFGLCTWVGARTFQVPPPPPFPIQLLIPLPYNANLMSHEAKTFQAHTEHGP